MSRAFWILLTGVALTATGLCEARGEDAPTSTSAPQTSTTPGISIPAVPESGPPMVDLPLPEEIDSRESSAANERIPVEPAVALSPITTPATATTSELAPLPAGTSPPGILSLSLPSGPGLNLWLTPPAKLASAIRLGDPQILAPKPEGLGGSPELLSARSLTSRSTTTKPRTIVRRSGNYRSPFPVAYSLAPQQPAAATAPAPPDPSVPTPPTWTVFSPAPPPPIEFLPRSDTIARFGWWAGGYTGSPVNVGMYEGLRPFPFADIDSLQSNGRGTLDLWASVLNSDSYDLRSRAYQNGYLMKFDFEQFPHQLPLIPSVGGTRDSTNQVVSENLNLGEDYAVRVQQLKANFSGPITDNISWKVNLFGFRKFGERQVNSMAHCFNMNIVGGRADNRCHILTQSQRIDWLTLEIEPGIVGKWDGLSVDYARTMRQFIANDQIVYAPFNHFGAFGGNGNNTTMYSYANVPNSTFQMDRLKIGYDFSQSLRLYSYLYQGDMTNLSRDTHNHFGGFDLRLIKTTQSGITATAYAKLNQTWSQLPPFLLPEEKLDPTMIWHPLNYKRFWTGLDGQWYPFRDADPTWQGMSFRAAYEYHTIDRQYANYPTDLGAGYVVPNTVANATITGPYFHQPITGTHMFVLGQRMKWESGVITYARYQMNLTTNPIYGLTPSSGALNSVQATDDQLIEIGGSWSPLSNLLLSARAEFQNSWLTTRYANFSQNNYPFLATLWYAPTQKLSVSAGYSFFSNWINQDVTLGYRGMDEPPPAETFRVGFNGQTQVVNVGARYAWTERLVLNGGIFWMNGFNVFNVPNTSQTGANWTNMPLYSDIRAESTRYQGGFDYTINPRIGCYFRVNVYDYQDNSQGTGSGTSTFFLAGINGVF